MEKISEKVSKNKIGHTPRVAGSIAIAVLLHACGGTSHLAIDESPISASTSETTSIRKNKTTTDINYKNADTATVPNVTTSSATSSARSNTNETSITDSTATKTSATSGSSNTTSQNLAPFSSVSRNTITLHNHAQAVIASYPFQIGRAFKSGEIPQGSCPTISDAGNIIPTQADIKNRWPDGSVRFAVLASIIPQIGAIETKALSIVAGTCLSGSADAITKLLEPSRNFDFVLEFKGAAGGRVSARDMIVQGKYSQWTGGEITSTVILADHEQKQFDVGMDANRSLRPIFHIQSWKALDLYRVRVIVESSDTTKLQDQSYAITIKSGLSNPEAVFDSGPIAHKAGTRWTKEFWIGARKPLYKIGVNHNVGYLATTKAIPNYDPNINLSSASELSIIDAWKASTKGLFQKGLWTSYMPTTGGRPDIGIFPTWHVAALYSGNPELMDVALGQTDLASAWPMHFRIGDSRVFDGKSPAIGLGRVVTRDSHPSQFLREGNNRMNSSATSLADKFTVIQPLSSSEWINDAAHQPEPWYLMYLLTGDPWYLEELQFWASWGLFVSNPNSATWGSGRDPRDAVIQDQLRGIAWVLRTRARAAWASVDGSPEKDYFTRVTEQALRQMEGMHIGTGSDPIRSWWAANGYLANNPLRYWDAGDPNLLENITAADVAAGHSPWMQSMLIQILGHVDELGFGSKEMLAWYGRSWISLILSGADPRHMADYRFPVSKVGGGLFQNWVDVFDSYTVWNSSWESNLRNLDHGYSVFAISALSYLKNEIDGAASWSWAYNNGYKLIDWSANPKMAILPR